MVPPIVANLFVHYTGWLKEFSLFAIGDDGLTADQFVKLICEKPIKIEFSRKALWIAFILLIGFSFSTGGVLASSCQGGADCLICATAVHPHLPGMDVEMVNPGCQSADQNGSCGFEAGQSPDDLEAIAAVVKSGSHPPPGIFSAAFVESGQAYLYQGFNTQFQYPDRSELTPIYLLNLSLLC